MTSAKQMVIMLVCVTTVFSAFSAFGVSNEAGVHAEPGLHEDVRTEGKDMENVSADREPGSEFTGGILGSITQVLGSYDLLYGAQDAPGNLGFNPKLGMLLGPPMVFIVGFALYKAVRGRGA